MGVTESAGFIAKVQRNVGQVVQVTRYHQAETVTKQHKLDQQKLQPVYSLV